MPDRRRQRLPVGGRVHGRHLVAQRGRVDVRKAGPAMQLGQLPGIAQAAKRPRERGPLGAERGGDGRPRLAEPGVLLDPRPHRRRDGAPGCEHTCRLAQGRHRVAGDHQCEPARDRRRTHRLRTAAARSCRPPGRSRTRPPCAPARARPPAGRRSCRRPSRRPRRGRARPSVGRCRSRGRAPWPPPPRRPASSGTPNGWSPEGGCGHIFTIGTPHLHPLGRRAPRSLEMTHLEGRSCS